VASDFDACRALVFEMADAWGAVITCVFCGQRITALNPCDRSECMEAGQKMRDASARMEQSFREHPLSLSLIPEGQWKMNHKRYMREAEES
jgi:hypothetical protein